MEKRKLGFTGVELTTVGFGAWALGGGGYDWGWGSQDDRNSIAAIQRGLDLGINWIDTAPEYGLGRSEEVVGKVIRGRREQIFIATKCGIVWKDRKSGETFGRLKAGSVRKELEDSLRRLGIEVIDLYQIHWPRPDEDIEEAWSEIARLAAEGKVRYAGVSNFSVEQIRRAQKIHPVASLQPEYNLLERGVEKELLAFCAQQNIGVIAYSPMASGLLTGKYDHETVKKIDPDDWRLKYDAEFREPYFSIDMALLEKMRPIARRFGRSLGELAVAWVLRRGEVTAAIVGARRPEQIEEITPASGWQLPVEVVEEMDGYLAERTSKIAANEV